MQTLTAESKAVKQTPNHKTTRIFRQRGLSIVELLVALTIGLFLILAVIEVMISGKQSFGSANNMSRLQENGRIATEMVVTNLKRAGYMGGNSDIDRINGTLPPLDPAPACATNNTNWVRMIEEPVFGLNDTNAGYACITDAEYLRGDVLTVRHAAPWIEAGALNGGSVYLRSSLFDGNIFLGADSADPTNAVLDVPNNVRELLAYSYFVGDSGRTCDGEAIPSLFRVRVDGNGRPVSEELLPGIEDFQVQYGDAPRYYDADDVPDWEAILTVRIWILVRAECNENGFDDGRTYMMGDQAYTPGDDFLRQLYTNVVMIRN